MSAESGHFETEIEGISGVRPQLPALWSYSSLTTLEACPRRWMLERADYPALWDRRGYPSLPIGSAVFGTLVHLMIERFSDAVGRTGSTAPASVVGVLKACGGWASLAAAALDNALVEFEGNPRVTPVSLDRLRDELVRRLPEAVDRVKLLLRDRTSITAGVRPAQPADLPTGGLRSPATTGTYIERTVAVEDLRLSGRFDVLSIDPDDVAISDFKTGADSGEHDDQIRLYALIWRYDALTNPTGRPATKLSIVYPSHERSVGAPDEPGLQVLYEATEARIAVADATVVSPSPQALPSPETCRFCQVKHLCDAYWASVPPAVATVPVDEWFDFEGRVARRNGSRSWVLETLDNLKLEVLVRTVNTDEPFQVGQRVRLLGVRRTLDPDDAERLVVSLFAGSEWFPVRS